MRRSQAARSRRERDVRAQAGKGAASPNHTVYIGTVANLKYCALPGGVGGGGGGGRGGGGGTAEFGNILAPKSRAHCSTYRYLNGF